MTHGGGPSLAPGIPLDEPERALIELATSPDAAQRCVQVALAAQTTDSVVIENVFYSPGRDCVVLLTIGGDRPHESRHAVVTIRRDNVLREAYRDRYASMAAGGTAMTPAAVLVEDGGYLVELFPMDFKLPSLPWALEPAEVGAVMPAIHGSRADVTVLRYVPHRRAVLGYPSGGGEVIGKLFARHGKAVQAWTALNAVHAVSRGRGVAVPAPLRYVADRDLVLMERLAGTPLDRVLSGATPGSGGRQAVAAAARLLAALHDLAPPDLPSPPPKLDEVRRLARRLRCIAPCLVERVEMLLEVVPPALASSSPPRTLVHGAYAPRQLLLDGDQVSIVDVDSAGYGDPAADVGYFMASLHDDAAATGRGELRELASHFLDCYLAERPSAGLATRARLHQGIVLLRGGLHSFCRPCRPPPGAPSLLPYLLLEEAAECLQAA
ncbi:phosphotransferase [Candidatus Solirubrobacter pratensis]|uniref:phosphotransferase n=1 Tax=Candidatus Solirubrobacter pratensis TaxID=1298857 RepID=UPI00040A6934|nr:phosphotransferase [Candidatus Solirubrobacter pratensis]